MDEIRQIEAETAALAAVVLANKSPLKTSGENPPLPEIVVEPLPELPKTPRDEGLPPLPQAPAETTTSPRGGKPGSKWAQAWDDIASDDVDEEQLKKLAEAKKKREEEEKARKAQEEEERKKREEEEERKRKKDEEERIKFEEEEKKRREEENRKKEEERRKRKEEEEARKKRLEDLQKQAAELKKTADKQGAKPTEGAGDSEAELVLKKLEEVRHSLHTFLSSTKILILIHPYFLGNSKSFGC